MQKGVDYIGVGVGAVILNGEGKVFLARRGREARNERHKWEFPGGSVEFGERLEEALVREVKEEYDFEIAVDRLLDVVNHIIPHEGQHWVSPTFLCRYESGFPSIMEPHKCEEIGWFDFKDIPAADLTLASAKSLESYRRVMGGVNE
jgi:mutator protein MutT